MTTADFYGASAGQQPPNSPPTKAALASWWERFKKRNGKDTGDKDDIPGIFGVPLQQSISYANVAISLTNADGQSQVYGYVPVVVAKCGVYLKEKGMLTPLILTIVRFPVATDVEGIFRLSGSAKRIKDLQTIFNSPDKYGKGLDWTGYTVHDAANVLRRYLNLLPEPIIPLDFYTRFRDPLTVNPKVFDVSEAIRIYQQLIKELPPLNRQLLLYILDLLAVFASKAELNLMTATNLAAIFQPGLISHPSHEMAPQAYKLSQDVLVFLINHQDHFLLGMKGTNDGAGGAELPQTPTTPSSRRQSNILVSRSDSNGSAGADDVRRFGGVRRNVSVSSKKSSSPVPRSGGVSRSNTLPSRRSPRVPNPVFRPVDGSASPRSIATNATVRKTPSSEGRLSEEINVERPSHIDMPKRGLGVRSADAGSMPGSRQVSGGSQLGTPQHLSPVTTPTRDRNFANIFSLSPGESDRPQRKLQKRRSPGSTNHSAESSTTSLAITPSTTELPPSSLPSVPGSPPLARTLSPTLAPMPMPHHNHHHGPGSCHGPSANTSGNLMPAMSPTPSATSSVTSQDSNRSFSDTTNTSTSPEKKKRSRWRWSNSKVDRWDPPTSPTFGNSNGSIAERIRRVSRSPPPGGRKASSEASDGDESRTSSRPFGWLPRRKPAEPKPEENIKQLALPPNAHFSPPQSVQTQHVQTQNIQGQYMRSPQMQAQHMQAQHMHSPSSSFHIQPPTPTATQVKPPMGPLREVSRESEIRQVIEENHAPVPREKSIVPQRDLPRPAQFAEAATAQRQMSPKRQSRVIPGDSTPADRSRTPRPISSMLYIDDPPPNHVNENKPTESSPVEVVRSPEIRPEDVPISISPVPAMRNHSPPVLNGTPPTPIELTDKPMEEPMDTPTEEPMDTPTQEPRDKSMEEPMNKPVEESNEPENTQLPPSPKEPKPKKESELPACLQVGVAR
ncbi:hypothetical protein EDC01DRAFT_630071 [Geopyxis carbonaria]|nr:hypothetical protein EDC01DRAFT_630071 [Geopyxis carbonaria]